MENSLLHQYNQMVLDGKVCEDTAQMEVLKYLQTVLNHLNSSVLQRLLKKAEPVQKCCYIHGSVGGGKSLLMQMLFDNFHKKEKLRVHFNELMYEAYKRISNGSSGTETEIEDFCDSFNNLKLLCLDELVVTDTTDSIVIRKLILHLLQKNVFIVITSNRHPDDLYENGLQKDLFKEFVLKLKEETQIIELIGNKDYRDLLFQSGNLTNKLLRIKHFSNSTEGSIFIESLVTKDTGNHVINQETINVYGRQVFIKRAFEGSAVFLAKDLFCENLSHNDYKAIVEKYNNIYVKNLTDEILQDKNIATRFVWFIDEVYDKRARLSMSTTFNFLEIETTRMNIFELERAFSRLKEMACW